MSSNANHQGSNQLPSWLEDDEEDDASVLDTLLSTLDTIYEEEQRLKQLKAQTRALIERALLALNQQEAESSTHKVQLKKSMKVSVPRVYSDQVYQLLYDQGFDCRVQSSVKRKLAVEILMGENQGQLPLNLVGLVEAQLVDTLVVKRK